VPSAFVYDKTFAFAVSRDALWDALNDTERFPEWWPWLRSFDTTGKMLVPGTVAHCAVRAPLPYTLEFAVRVERVVAGESIDTVVSGDLEGPARLEVGGDDRKSSARLTWSVELRLPFLSAAWRGRCCSGPTTASCRPASSSSATVRWHTDRLLSPVSPNSQLRVRSCERAR
jgi:carbon monoxide dehydrogenase subunit G